MARRGSGSCRASADTECRCRARCTGSPRASIARIQVDPTDAEHVAKFVDDLLATGWLDVDQPLLFSPRVGDEVLVTQEALAEVSRVGKNAPSSWRLVAAGTRGKLIGWRDTEGEPAKAVIDLADVERRLVVFVSERKVTRARRRRRL